MLSSKWFCLELFPLLSYVFTPRNFKYLDNKSIIRELFVGIVVSYEVSILDLVSPFHGHIWLFSPPVGGGGALRYRGGGGGAPSFRISRKKGSFFKTSACPRFCKRSVLFCT